jgi:hypothetical protein
VFLDFFYVQLFFISRFGLGRAEYKYFAPIMGKIVLEVAIAGTKFMCSVMFSFFVLYKYWMYKVVSKTFLFVIYYSMAVIFLYFFIISSPLQKENN